MSVPPLLLVTPPSPALLPVTLDDAKRQLVVMFNDDDDRILQHIQAAVAELDGAAGRLFRCIMAQTWEQYLDAFPLCGDGRIDLPLGPVSEVGAVTYVDPAGDSQTLDPELWEFLPATSAGAAFIRLTEGSAYPATRCQRRAVAIRFTAGAATAAAVPPDLKGAILLHIDHLYNGRDGELPAAYHNALAKIARPVLG